VRLNSYTILVQHSGNCNAYDNMLRLYNSNFHNHTSQIQLPTSRLCIEFRLESYEVSDCKVGNKVQGIQLYADWNSSE
jgi:hypothetical protein